MTTSTSPTSAGQATVSSALPLAILASTQSAATQSSSQNLTTISSKVPDKVSIAAKARQWLWSRSRKAVGVIVFPINKVFKSFEKTTSIFGLLLTLLFGPLGFVAVKIAIWQSLKDWYFYCLEQKKVDEMKVLTRQKCEKILQQGLPPPPFSVFKRDVMSVAKHTSLHTRSVMDKQTAPSEANSLTTIHEEHFRSRLMSDIGVIIGTLLPVALAVFVLSVLAIRLARRAWRRLRVRSSSTSQIFILRNEKSLFLGISILLMVVTVIGIVAQAIALEHMKAEQDYSTYCQSLPKQELSEECAIAIAIEKTRDEVIHSSGDLIHAFTAFTIATAVLTAIAAIIWIFTLADLQMIKRIRRTVRARLDWIRDPEQGLEQVVSKKLCKGDINRQLFANVSKTSHIATSIKTECAQRNLGVHLLR